MNYTRGLLTWPRFSSSQRRLAPSAASVVTTETRRRTRSAESAPPTTNDWRTWCLESSAQSQHDFDRAVLTLASGALAISLVFVHDIAPRPSWKALLVIAWVAFVVSMLAVLLSFRTSEWAHRDEYERIQSDRPEAKDAWTPALNAIATAALIGGIALLLAFATLNLG